MSRKTILCSLILLSFALNLPATAGDDETSEARRPVCHECLKIRVGIPRIMLGPAGGIADNTFSEIQLPNGHFRGFTAAAETFAIDGEHPSDMDGPLRKVLGRGVPGAFDSCGQWLEHAEQSDNRILGFIHDETVCNYRANFQTHKSMSLAISPDYGLTWYSQGQFITGRDAPTPNKITGEGDCTAMNGHDGYYYAYCLRNRDGAIIVARGPVSDPRPANWMKFFEGKWEQPGLGGDATGLGPGLSSSVARWKTTGETVLGAWRLSFSTDHTTFTHLREPLLVPDPARWNRPDPSELKAYGSLVDAETGRNQLSNSWILSYMYIQPNESFDKRYLVFRNVHVSISDEPATPQVGVQLARWHNAALHDRWSTTAPVPGNFSSYQLEAKSGYLMTVADAAKPSVELEDCVSQWPGHPDHILAEKGVCEAGHYQRLRTAGWVYGGPQEHTVPLYRCYNAQEHSHFASNESDCERLGTMEGLLGYALSQ